MALLFRWRNFSSLYCDENLSGASLQDVQWNDLDYAEGNKIWTWDDKTYKGLPQIIHDLHDHGQHNVIIVVGYESSVCLMCLYTLFFLMFNCLKYASEIFQAVPDDKFHWDLHFVLVLMTLT